jgi:hemoglobin
MTKTVFTRNHHRNRIINVSRFIFPFVALAASLLIMPCIAADKTASIPGKDKPNSICPISGEAVNPEITWTYEGRTFAFAQEACREKFKADRKASLYHKLGGKPAIDAAIEAFYVKVLADARVKHYFEDINMKKQRRKQKEFLSAAFGGPIPWLGKDMRKAHAHLPGLNETHFNAIAENLQTTLTELKIKPELIRQAMAAAGSLKPAVLNRPVSTVK